MNAAPILRSITFKLWLSLAFALLLTLSIAFAVSYISTQKRFISFSFDTLKEQLIPLEEEINEVYEQHQSLDLFKNDPKAWPIIVRRTLRFTRDINADRRPPPPPEHAPPLKGKQFKHSSKSLHEAQKRFARTLSLYDAEKQNIAKAKIPPKKSYWHPVKNEDRVIAYISFEKPRYVLKKSEALFLQNLLTLFTQISIVMIIISVIASAIISRWFLSPISKISISSRKVARGDLSTRVDYSSDDEIGELCKNFNEMCAKLEANEKARRQWVADISHEMRTPVAVLKAQIEAMLDGIRPLTHESLTLLSTKIESLEQLINDLYELALSDSGNLKLNLNETDLDELIDTFIEDNLARANSKGFDLIYHSELNSITYLTVDALKILQILNNILNNSLHYTDAPGEIIWHLSDSGQNLVLETEDSAPGVEVKELEKIFDRLYRIEKSRSRATGGAGLGLALSRNIAQAHGGSLCASTSELGGLKLTLTLPKN